MEGRSWRFWKVLKQRFNEVCILRYISFSVEDEEKRGIMWSVNRL